MKDFLFGVCHPGRHYRALKDIGINAVRFDVPFPFADQDGTWTEAFQRHADWVREMRSEGFELVGISPYPRSFPEWNGEVGSDGWYRTVRDTCRALGEIFKNEIRVWQCSNELNLSDFRTPLDADQALRFLRESADGLKEADASLFVGVNMGGFDELAISMYRDLYTDADSRWNYIGTDGYFGTWEPGGPHTWEEKFDFLETITSLPIIVMEWGYSSAGEILKPEQIIPNATDPHEHEKWCFGWEPPRGSHKPHPHTPAEQARYIEEAMPIIRARTIGEIYYCLNDASRCSCGKLTCPVEANWGLLATGGDPKPSYYAMQRSIAVCK